MPQEQDMEPTDASPNAAASTTPAFDAPFAPPDEPIAAQLLAESRMPDEARARVDACAAALIEAIRKPDGAFAARIGGVEDLLHEYALSTREGVALMMLAEALLRVPDAATADQLLEDKLDDGDWAGHDLRADALLASASAWGLALAARIVAPGDTPQGILATLAHRIGAPAVRAAARKAIAIMGAHFVLGETIEDALAHTTSRQGRLYRYSFDMLGEGARTAADADRYFRAYAGAIEAIGARAGDRPLPARPGISIKLSALHPRFEPLSRDRVMGELAPRLLELARAARNHDLNVTVDAEEADRLELSLEVCAAVLADPSLAGWDGFGLAVQAYQKRARAVIDHIDELAQAFRRRLMIRLVKGAYWDTEIKRAQERGLADYPVFTRKAMTDLNFMACAQRLLDLRPRLYPQFATHNALTVGTILERAGPSDGYEFQRLHGMGEELYARLLTMNPRCACRVYAPVGAHKDLLAYLVRRLLENGANSSFVARVADPAVPVADLLVRPRDILSTPALARHPAIVRPDEIFPDRRNSRGVEFGERAAVRVLQDEMAPFQNRLYSVAPLTSGASGAQKPAPCLSPIDGARIGAVFHASAEQVEAALASANAAFPAWSATAPSDRATIIERAGDLIEANRGELLALLQREGGKTLDDAIAELREAADFCRYYAAQTHTALADRPMPGPTGEANILRYRGRGVFVCISPWNFPLAIFTGQIAAALAAGNSVIAKPAEQTPLIAERMTRLLLEAGVPSGVLHCLPGGGDVGAMLTQHPLTAGVAFTGSTQTARLINRALAARDAPIAPLIAETGGINAMIVDATALPEQVVDDVLTSAFRSAGQRCSALRLLCLQEDIADNIIAMIIGAVQELQIGDPRRIDTHIGPVIDRQAQENLHAYIDDLRKRSPEQILYAGQKPARGSFVAPHVITLRDASELQREVFGPVLHMVRWPADHRRAGLAALLEQLSANGYGLTLGVHSRIADTVDFVIARMTTGNIYVNRNMIGAIVGSQPFGGHGLSGTGPKAGGPNYLPRFTAEQVVSTNTAAAGGNASLMTIEEA